MDNAQAHIWGPGVKVDTPNIDSIAKDGALFTNFYVASPVCTPSRGTFMTGTYPSLNGAFENHAPLNDDAVTFAQILQQELGYYTGYMGKVCMCSMFITYTVYSFCDMYSFHSRTNSGISMVNRKARQNLVLLKAGHLDSTIQSTNGTEDIGNS